MADGAAMTAPGAFADIQALRACWHPVAFSHKLADRPAHSDLLGQPLVLWRGTDGEARPGPVRAPRHCAVAWLGQRR